MAIFTFNDIPKKYKSTVLSLLKSTRPYLEDNDIQGFFDEINKMNAGFDYSEATEAERNKYYNIETAKKYITLLIYQEFGNGIFSLIDDTVPENAFEGDEYDDFWPDLNIKVANNIKTLGPSCFNNPHIKKLDLANVEVVQDSSCAFLRLNSLTIPSTVKSYNSTSFGHSWIKELNLESTIDIPNEAFAYNLKLTNLTLPEGLKNIGAMAFRGCSKLKTLNIPDSVEFIGTEAFGYCDNLTKVYLPKNLNSNSKPGAFNKSGSRVSDMIFYIYHGQEDMFNAIKDRLTKNSNLNINSIYRD